MMNGFILQENTSILISRNGKNIVYHFTQESGLDSENTTGEFLDKKISKTSIK